MSSTDPSVHCDCRRITIRRIYVGAAIGCFVSLGLFVFAAFRGFAAFWMFAAGSVQSVSVIALGVAAKMSRWRWWYVTLGLGVASIILWLRYFL